MKIRCAILDDYQGVALSMTDWSALRGEIDFVVFRDHMVAEDEIVAAIGDCMILVVMRERTPLTASFLGRLTRLKLVVTSGMRNASIDVAAATRLGITVCGTSSASEPPAELTWALILGLARHLVDEAVALRGNGPWQSTVGTSLHGRRLGLIGLGKIGTRVARVGAAFGMDVVAWSANLTPERATANGARWVSKKELMRTSDFVSIHLVLSDRTRGLIGAEELGQMQKTAYLVNTSRAAIVDREALAEALRAQGIAGVGLDVFDEEPLLSNDMFRGLRNVLATPHLGYVSDSNYRMYYRETVEDIVAFLSGTPIRRISS